MTNNKVKTERIHRIFLLCMVVVICWGTTISAKENPSVSAKLQKKYQYVTFMNENGLEYYEISRTNPDDPDAEVCGIANTKGKVLISYTNYYALISPIQLQDFGANEFRKDIYYWALQTYDNQFGIADKNGKIIIPCTPGTGIYLTEYITPEGTPFDYNYERDGWGFVMQGDKYSALYDEKGKEIIPLSRGYSDIYLRVDANGVKYLKVRKNGKVGICDQTGKETVPPIYTDMELKNYQVKQTIN